MFHFKYRFAAALVTFTIGVFIASAVATVWRISGITEAEQAPCKGCASLYAGPEIPSISICELKKNLEFYRGKVVRVHASFQHDAGQVSLLDDACPKVALHAGPGDGCQSCIGASKALTIYSGYGTWYDSTARVVILGKVGRLENPTLFDDDNGFNIACVESAEPIGSGREDRIRYTLGELFGLNPPKMQAADNTRLELTRR